MCSSCRGALDKDGEQETVGGRIASSIKGSSSLFDPTLIEALYDPPSLLMISKEEVTASSEFSEMSSIEDAEAEAKLPCKATLSTESWAESETEDENQVCKLVYE